MHARPHHDPGLSRPCLPVMAPFGERNWWLPAWLDRALPQTLLEAPAPAPAT